MTAPSHLAAFRLSGNRPIRRTPWERLREHAGRLLKKQSDE